MFGKHVVVTFLFLLCALPLGGCVVSFAGLGAAGGASPAGGPGPRAEELAASIGNIPPGASAAALDPQTGTAVEMRVESEYLSGTGEICRRASLPNTAGGQRAATACKGRDGWVLVPEIASFPLGVRR